MTIVVITMYVVLETTCVVYCGPFFCQCYVVHLGNTISLKLKNVKRFYSAHP